MVMAGVPKFTKDPCRGRRAVQGQAVWTPCSVPRAEALLAAPLFSLSVRLPWDFPHSGELSGGGGALFGVSVLCSPSLLPCLFSSAGLVIRSLALSGLGC